jgi:uncharacterized membrane protein
MGRKPGKLRAVGYGLVYGLGFALFILLGNYAGGVHGPSLVRTLVDFLAAGVIGAILGLVGRKQKSTARGAGTVIDALPLTSGTYDRLREI